MPLWLVLAPFVIAYFFLIMAIFPQYLRSEKSIFHLPRTASADHFTFSHDLGV